MKPVALLSALGLWLPLVLVAGCHDPHVTHDQGDGMVSGTPALDALLGELRADPQAALTKHADSQGFPVPVEGGFLFVSTDLTKPLLAGDHDGWTGTPMQEDTGFLWAVLPVAHGDHYRFTDKTSSIADPWARAFDYDMMGAEVSLVKPDGAHLERFNEVGDGVLKPRTLRVWVPAGPITHVLYVHDGQNLFDPNGPYGSWKLSKSAPEGMLLVGIDNTSDRIDEYTHVQDVIDDSGQPVGGKADAYADLLKNTIRPLIRQHYGETGPVGVMGSSLGGLISFYLAYRDPGEYAFAASLSGTMGWGTIGEGVHNPTMIEIFKDHGHQDPVLYQDSGSGGTCPDADGDGIHNDDPEDFDNYCSNAQLRDTLLSVGYTQDKDLFYWWEQGAVHNEAAWAARVSRPLSIFHGLR